MACSQGKLATNGPCRGAGNAALFTVAIFGDNRGAEKGGQRDTPRGAHDDAMAPATVVCLGSA